MGKKLAIWIVFAVSAVIGGEAKLCNSTIDSGPCDSAITRWGYDCEKNECIEFDYGGCEGNKNNFVSKKECEDFCGDVGCNGTAKHAVRTPSPYLGYDVKNCESVIEGGNCFDYNDTVTKWAYDCKSMSCVEFVYSGCDGNGNNFPTVDDCEQACIGHYCKQELKEEFKKEEATTEAEMTTTEETMTLSYDDDYFNSVEKTSDAQDKKASNKINDEVEHYKMLYWKEKAKNEILLKSISNHKKVYHTEDEQ